MTEYELVSSVITVQTIQSKGSTTNDAGHIIGNQLGDSGRKNYNIFPRSPNINRDVWSREENTIRNLFLSTKQPIEVVIQLYYPTKSATRPKHCTYRAAYGNACHSASVINP